MADGLFIPSDPQEPQVRFSSKEEAIAYAEKISLATGVGFMVEDYEAPSIGI